FMGIPGVLGGGFPIPGKPGMPLLPPGLPVFGEGGLAMMGMSVSGPGRIKDRVDRYMGIPTAEKIMKSLPERFFEFKAMDEPPSRTLQYDFMKGIEPIGELLPHPETQTEPMSIDGDEEVGVEAGPLGTDVSSKSPATAPPSSQAATSAPTISITTTTPTSHSPSLSITTTVTATTLPQSNLFTIPTTPELRSAFAALNIPMLSPLPADASDTASRKASAVAPGGDDVCGGAASSEVVDGESSNVDQDAMDVDGDVGERRTNLGLGIHTDRGEAGVHVVEGGAANGKDNDEGEVAKHDELHDDHEMDLDETGLRQLLGWSSDSDEGGPSQSPPRMGSGVNGVGENAGTEEKGMNHAEKERSGMSESASAGMDAVVRNLGPAFMAAMAAMTSQTSPTTTTTTTTAPTTSSGASHLELDLDALMKTTTDTGKNAASSEGADSSSSPAKPAASEQQQRGANEDQHPTEKTDSTESSSSSSTAGGSGISTTTIDAAAAAAASFMPLSLEHMHISAEAMQSLAMLFGGGGPGMGMVMGLVDAGSGDATQQKQATQDPPQSSEHTTESPADAGETDTGEPRSGTEKSTDQPSHTNSFPNSNDEGAAAAAAAAAMGLNMLPHDLAAAITAAAAAVAYSSGLMPQEMIASAVSAAMGHHNQMLLQHPGRNPAQGDHSHQNQSSAPQQSGEGTVNGSGAKGVEGGGDMEGNGATASANEGVDRDVK
ncbi:hypothetical protein HK102_001587, partial [Quaeritorhiza haematococci]